MADLVTPKWKQKYLDTLKRLVEAQNEIERNAIVIQDLRMLCNQQQEELQYFKYKDAGKQ